MMKEINNMRTQKIEQEELDRTKAFYNGNFALSLENPARIATFASTILINGLPKDFYRTYLQKINAVTVADVQRVANKYFNHDNARIVVVGKASDVSEGLKKLNYPVKQFDKYAKPVSASTGGSGSTNTANVDAKTVINDYIKAIGGIDEIKKVNSLVVTAGMEMQGMALEMEQKKMLPNLEVTTVKMQGNVVNKSLFDGTNGFEEQMGQKKPMSEDNVKDKKGQTSLFDQADYFTGNFKVQVQGTEKVNGKDAYKLLVTTPSGKTQTEYYDVQSKLLVKLEKDEMSNNMTISNTVEFGDYKKFGNLLLPYKQKVTMAAGGQEQSFEMNVKDVKVNEGVTAADFK